MLCSHERVVQHGVEAFLGFCRRDTADGRAQAAVVEAIDQFERGELIFGLPHRHKLAGWASSSLQHLLAVHQSAGGPVCSFREAEQVGAGIPQSLIRN